MLLSFLTFIQQTLPKSSFIFTCYVHPTPIHKVSLLIFLFLPIFIQALLPLIVTLFNYKCTWLPAVIVFFLLNFSPVETLSKSSGRFVYYKFINDRDKRALHFRHLIPFPNGFYFTNYFPFVCLCSHFSPPTVTIFNQTHSWIAFCYSTFPSFTCSPTSPRSTYLDLGHWWCAVWGHEGASSRWGRGDHRVLVEGGRGWVDKAAPQCAPTWIAAALGGEG